MSPKSVKANKVAPPPTRGALALLLLGIAESGWSIYQWVELLTVRAGGETVCSVNETVNCAKVWNTPFASRVHELLGIPVAGLGLVWGLVAVGLAALYLAWARAGRAVGPAAVALRLWAVAGLVSVAVFASVSAGAEAVCLTCLGTYALVVAFAGFAWRGLPGPLVPAGGEVGTALKWTVGFAVAALVAMQVPGRATPKATSDTVALLPPVLPTTPTTPTMPPPGVTSSPTPTPSPAAPRAAPGTLAAYLQNLPFQQQQQMSNALMAYRMGSPLPAPGPARQLYGPADAPVKIVEWTDSKCPHCKMLVSELAELKKRVPAGKMSLEARQFPLDGACNPAIPQKGLVGVPSVRCEAAKAQICLEGASDFWTLREKMFAQQEVLDTEKVRQIASSGSMSRMQLDACMQSQAPLQKIQEDVTYALKHNISGTPLVVVNGRQAPPSAIFIYALVMAGGNPNDPAFDVLPPARMMPSADNHAGHGH